MASSSSGMEEQCVGPDVPPPIQRLTEDLLRDILRRVSEDTGDFQHALVCRKWNQLTASAQRYVHMKQHDPRNFWSLVPALQQLRRFRSLTALEIDHGFLHIKDDMMGVFMALFPDLQSVRLGEYPLDGHWAGQGSLEVPNGCLRNFAAAMENLKRLVITGCHDVSPFPEALTALTQLEELTVGVLREGLPTGLRLSNLKSLRLDFTVGGNVIAAPGPITLVTSLTNLDVRGELRVTEEIGLLTTLASLRIHANSTANSIPRTISTLVRLTNLDVEHSAIDVAWLRPLSALRALRMVECAVASPAAVSELRGLTELATFASYLARSSQLSAVSSLTALRPRTLEHGLRICQMTALQSLKIERSRLRVPLQLGSLRNLRHLRLEGNRFAKKFPASIGELRHLTFLSVLGFDRLLSLPDSIRALSNLATLNIAWCDSFDCLPDAISGLSSLDALTLKSLDSLEEIPASLGALCKLTHLSFDSCESLVQLPQTMTLLTTLRGLNIAHCPVRCIPSGLASLPFLNDRCRKQILENTGEDQ